MKKFSFGISLALGVIIASASLIVGSANLFVAGAQNYAQVPSGASQTMPMQYGAVSGQASMPSAATTNLPAQNPYNMPVYTGSNIQWPASEDLIVTTAPNVEGYRIVHYKGLVEGVAVRQPTWGQNFKANFQGMFGGGSIEAYGQMCEQSRLQAYNNLIQRTRGMGANAVIAIHFDSESFSLDSNRFATAVVCYGTAVTIEPVK